MLQKFVQSVEDTARNVMNGIHTAMPGTVISMNLETGRAVVKPVGRFITEKGEKLEFPQISDVPVVMPFSQTAVCGIAVPVVAGDSCLIIISEFELDEWLTGAMAEGSMKYDLTNAIMIPGLTKVPNALLLEACKSGATVVGAGANRIAVSGSGIAISGNLSVSGSISVGGTVKAGGIDLKTHTHVSGEAGESTGAPQ